MLSPERILPRDHAATIEFWSQVLVDALERDRQEDSGTKWYDKARRWLCRNDLFYLLVRACNRADMNHPWLFERCREVQLNPNGWLDLWARDHYKSTIITFGLSLQDILASHGEDPEPRYGGREVTIGILSFNRPTAKSFLRQIKREMEDNDDLKALFPDILWEKPGYQAPKWSEDDGLVVKRKTNPKEATVEASGLVDGMPTGKHFFILVYDDVVTRESVYTPDMIDKTTSAWELSSNLSTENGWKRYIGTRYHLFDTYATMMERGIPDRTYPCTSDGSEDFEKAVLKSPEHLREKRREQGPFTFACFPAGSPVLMADWTEKPVESLVVGDEVVGYDFPKASKSRLVRSTVLAVNSRIMPVIEAEFESGRIVRCTEDHKWYTGRRGKDVGGTDNHSAYLPLGFEKCNLKALISIYDPRHVNGEFDQFEAAWLSGFFDGEGAVSGNQIHFHQSSEKNLIVCERLERALNTLGYDFGMTPRNNRGKNWQDSRDYYIRGGREEHIRFLRQCRPARADKIIDALYDRGTKKFGKACRDRLVAIRPIGRKRVYNIETSTGNYVCWGYATKNCQMLLNPIADTAQGFREEWLEHWPNDSVAGLNLYILVDPASKKKKDSDYTSMWVIGAGADKNYYVVDGVHDRLNLKERQNVLFELHRRYSPLGVAYEEYGSQADIEHMAFVMDQENYRFVITPVGGRLSKEDRIRRLVPKFESGRVFLPRSGIVKINYEGLAVDICQEFVNKEYLAFPVCQHDDQLDCLSRLDDINILFPAPDQSIDPEMPKWMADHIEDSGGDWYTA